MIEFCLQCGAPTTQELENKFVCANGHENWLNPIPTATVYVIKDNKVLFGVRSIPPGVGKLNTPGGIMELHESFEEAAVREAKEETGLDVRLLDYLCSYTDKYLDGRDMVNVCFVAEQIGGEYVGGDDLAGGEAVWRDIDDLPSREELAWPSQVAAQAELVKWHKKREA
jgi:ADP-ribose pyrophosphatase YjhB (NUDIX family)